MSGLNYLVVDLFVWNIFKVCGLNCIDYYH